MYFITVTRQRFRRWAKNILLLWFLGYVLDGFPTNDANAKELFDITEEDETGEDEDDSIALKLPGMTLRILKVLNKYLQSDIDADFVVQLVHYQKEIKKK